MTPYQLFAEGMSCAAELNMPTATSVLNISQNPQVNIQPDVHEAVEVPEVSFVPCQVLAHQLQLLVHPLQSCSDHGKQMYSQTVRIVGQQLLVSICYLVVMSV